MKVALAQMEVVAGRPKKNLETMLAMIEQAKREGADLVAFPEMALPGYLVGDEFLSDGFCEEMMRFNGKLLEASEGIAIAYGNIFLDKDINHRVGEEEGGLHPNEDGRIRRYNAVYIVQNGKPARRVKETTLLPAGVQSKTLLPNYRMFDDERYFFSTEGVAKDFGISLEALMQPFLIETKSGNVAVGFEVCEDLWCADYRKGGKALNPTKMLIENGAELLVNISASPWTYGKNGARDRRIKFLKEESGDAFAPFLYVNCTGVQNNGKNFVTFDGGSTAYNAQGLPVALSKKPYEPELMLVTDADLAKRPVAREENPRIAQKFEAIIQGIRHLKNTMGSEEEPRFVIGLSGGVDSALVAALLTEAVGPGKVLALNLPTKYNSVKTQNAAEHVATQLGIAYAVLPIDDLVERNAALIDALDADGNGQRLSEFNLENVQAKIRGTSILSNVAAKYGALFTCNGNKLEIALGYATLYGDVGGAIAPLGDLTKSEVFEMARYVNTRLCREVIPQLLLPDELYRFGEEQIAPSAELKANQVDPMKFGYHDALLNAMTDYLKKGPGDIMKWYLEGTLEKNLGVSTALLERYGIDRPEVFTEDLEWFTRKVRQNVFKRVQAPPIIITSKSAYGYDIRESILPLEPSGEHELLKESVLALERYQPATERT